MNTSIAALVHEGFNALTSGRAELAADCCRQALAIDPQCIQAHFLVGLIATDRNDPKTAASAFGSVTRLDAGHVAAWAQLARVFVQTGQLQRADQALAKALALDTDDATVLDTLGAVQSLLGNQHSAHALYQRAAAARPDHVPFQINLANANIFLGDLSAAQTAIERALALDPINPQGHWLFSTSRTATDHTHIETLQALIERASGAPQALAFLCYAAGKEHEDLEEWDAAFAAFARGAAARRSRITFDERAEVATFAALDAHLSYEFLQRRDSGIDDAGPIFVLGQPRTGTTLVERIITSHSQVHSAGELQQFRLSIRRLVNVPEGERLSPRMVEAAAALDPTALGTAYLNAVAGARGTKARFVDKLPTNYLFIPLIARALPRARIVHVTRDPMDSCFASFKQLFADAYPHSYDQAEMARHYARYHRLMALWRQRLPGRIIDVNYESLVADVEAQSRRLIDALGLPWEDASLDFHRQPHAVATASAVQVREPAHGRSVGRWNRYRSHLEPMRRVLMAAGLA